MERRLQDRQKEIAQIPMVVRLEGTNSAGDDLSSNTWSQCVSLATL